mgnify:CR=1 FL=1
MFKKDLSCFDNGIVVICGGYICYIVNDFMGLMDLW